MSATHARRRTAGGRRLRLLGTRTAAVTTVAFFALAPITSLPAAQGAERTRDAVGSAPPTAKTSLVQEVTDMTGELTPERLAERLVGEDIEISKVTYVGSPLAAGNFSGFEAEFGPDFTAGIALSSGSIAGDDSQGYVSNLLGPNTSDSVSAQLGQAGDDDLDEVVKPLVTYDASVLEFDFVPQGPAVSFSYVFGSEEYLEFVGQGYNDVFAFFVNGVNCATVPDPLGGPDPVPVTIDTINKTANPTLFRSNSLADQPPAPHNTELDGYTVPLTCNAEVDMGEVNHLKLAIADTADTEWDSTVLLPRGTFAVAEADLAVDVSASPEQAEAGASEPVSYTVSLSNVGPQPGVNPHFELALDQPLNGVTAPPPTGWECTPTATLVTCDAAVLEVGVSVPITVTGTVPPDTAAGPLTGTATISSGTTDPNTGNNVDTAAVEILRVSDLSATSVTGPDQAVVGVPVRFEATVANRGPSTASGTATLSPTGDVAPFGPIAPGAPATVVFDDVTFAEPGTVDVTVTFDGTETDPDESDNDATMSVKVLPSSDLAVDLLPPAEPVHAGDPVTWSATVINNGPNDAADATYDLVVERLEDLRDPVFPAGWDCTVVATGLACDRPLLPATDGGTFSLTGTLPADAPADELSARAIVGSASQDLVPGNDDETVTVGTDRSADVEATSLTGPSSVLVGLSDEFTATVTNTGPSTATGVTATLEGQVRAIGDLAPGESGTAVFDVTFGTVGTATLRLEVDAAEDDSDPENDFTELTVEVLPRAELAVDLTPPSGSVAAGAPAEWAIAVENAGPSDATTATLDLALDGAITVVSDAGWACAPVAGGLHCDKGLLASGAVDTIVVSATMPPDAPEGSWTGSATVASEVADTGPGDDTDTESVTLERQVDLVVTIVGPEDALVDEVFPVAVTVTNRGPSTATGTVAEVSADGVSTMIDFGVLQPGQVVQQDADVSFGSHGLKPVDVDVTSVEAELEDADNHARTFVEVFRSADLSVTLVAPDDPVHAGDVATWTATVTNDGPSSAIDAAFDLELPADIGRISAPGWECGVDDESLHCEDGFLPVGSTTIEVRASVPPDSLVDELAGTATVASAVADVDLTDNEATDDVAIDRQVDLLVEVTAPAVALVQEQFTVEAEVTNLGPSTARGIVARLSTGDLFDIGTLEPGDTARREVDVIRGVAGVSATTAEATADEPEADQTNNVGSAPTDVRPLEITLVPDDTTSLTGSEFAATAVVTAGDKPIEDAEVAFRARMDTQPQATSTVQTNASGAATFAYVRDAEGVDDIVATVVVRGVESSARISHTWETAPGGLTITLTPPGTTTEVGEEFEATVVVADDDGPLANAQIEFSTTMDGVTGVPVVTDSARTDSRGRASFTYTRDQAGIDTVVAEVTVDERQGQASIAHIWVAPELLVTLSPGGASTPVGSEFVATVTAVTADGNPAVGASVELVSSGSGFDAVRDTQRTDADGEATFAYTRDEAGTDVIQAQVTSGELSGEATVSHQWVGTLPLAEQCLVLDQPAITPGGTIVASGTGPPGTDVTITLDDQPLTVATTDATGRYEVEIAPPALEIGRYTIGASCGAAVFTADSLDVVSQSSTTGTAAAAITTTATILTFFVLLVGPLTRLGSTGFEVG